MEALITMKNTIQNETSRLTEIGGGTAHICYYGNCLTCNYYDDYRGNYCKKHDTETHPKSSCKDYVRR